jgi:hypothetical protein
MTKNPTTASEPAAMAAPMARLRKYRSSGSSSYRTASDVRNTADR